ncbi:PREDICTED: vinorine synthase-like [Fragaria vesca subsp. vesca]|uniref:vinorine synthase-like n=1 Tax=Fragaria vesca subsp. vesca TaxID=101020 RepID=UPI0002C3578B|nr:PREDICTED: vinorine synthase-like [Fragaria vesca subsp. vesca]
MKILQVEVVSEEKIKPSFPTPSHLKTFKLSLLDHLIPAPYAPIILFYNPISTVTTTTRLELLKASLSEALTEFYPLAGKLNDDDVYVECNDEGAAFIETRVKHFTLHEFLSRPELFDSLLKQFLPGNITHTSSGNFVTNIQANVFKCGGIAIGICISHKLLDGAALCTFLKSWTAIGRRLLSGSSEKAAPPRISPNLSAAASLFPTNGDLWLRDSSLHMWGSLFIQGKESSVTKRFVFDASAIATLKLNARMARKKPPTRVEVVSAFLWQCCMAASKEKHGIQRPSLLTHIVNLRSKLLNAMDDGRDSGSDLQYSTGNLLWMAAARSYIGDSDEDDEQQEQQNSVLPDLVSEVRNALSRIDAGFAKEIQGKQGKSLMIDSLEGIMNSDGLDLDYYGFSSWCKFGWYEAADFGWGKPAWVSSIGSSSAPHFMNLIILVDTKSGDGIEAWVTLDQRQMTLLEANSDLRKLVSVDPSPLDL